MLQAVAEPWARARPAYTCVWPWSGSRCAADLAAGAEGQGGGRPAAAALVPAAGGATCSMISQKSAADEGRV